MARLAAEVRLRSEDRALIVDGSRRLLQVSIGRCWAFVVAKSSHHRVHVEIIRLSAAE